ncbi:MAG: hypothetical protein ACRDF5_00715 [bacterium]
MRRGAHGESGLVLTLVLVVFLIVEVIVAGTLSLVMGDLQASVAGQLTLHGVSVAEAGLNYGVGELVSRAAGPGSSADGLALSDETYAGEPEDIALTGTGGRPLGTFALTVACVYPLEGIPPGCQDDPGTAVDERDLRRILATGFVPARPGRARRQIEATVRRYVLLPGDVNVFGICGRERVELGPATTVTADVGSNGDVLVDGPQGRPGTVAGRIPGAPPFAPLAEAVAPEGTPGLSGTYSWRITFFDERGEESGGSPPTSLLLLAGERGRLTQVPLGGPSVVRRRVYRTSADAPRGPWFLVGEIGDNEGREFADAQPDSSLRWRIPGVIAGRVTAAGHVLCPKGCESQVDGRVASEVREVVCPNFLAAPAQPGGEPAPEAIIQTAPTETVRWGRLHVRADKSVTIETLSVPGAVLHVHLTDILLEGGARLAITGAATVYFHVSESFVLEEGAVFGAIDSSGNLLRPADRVHVLLDRRDPPLGDGAVASVRWHGRNKVAAVLFAPGANILIDRATEVRGGLYGRSIKITRSTGVFLDPIEGLGSEKSLVRASPFQYVLRWYDNPHPDAER